MAAEDARAAPGGIDLRAVRRHFARASATYDAAAVLQREVAARLAARLDVVKLVPRRLLDAGCGTGDALGEFALRYPQAQRVALDLALPMLAGARAKTTARRSLAGRLLAPLRSRQGAAVPGFACGDIAALPFAAASFDLVWSNLALQWVADPRQAFAEVLRVLDTGGLFVFTTFGPDTLRELRAVFAAIDGEPHVSRFLDLHDVGDLLVEAGFADPVMEMERFTLTYAGAADFLHDLKAIGATNAASARRAPERGRN